MKNKIIFAFALALGFNMLSLNNLSAVERQYGMAGCGLGSALLGKKSGQIFASTTNGSFGSQTLGITFGTSNCLDSKNKSLFGLLDRFISANKVVLAADMARGEGEKLNTLATLLKCTEKKYFKETMQKNFTIIYPNEKVTFMNVTDSILNVMAKNDRLSSGCHAIM